MAEAKSTACTLSYGKTTIAYELLRMRRVSLEIAVHPDKTVVVKAPATATTQAIESKIRQRARWIKKQIAGFSRFDPRTPPRQYVGGESHLYLGRKYRLKIEAYPGGSTDKRQKVVLKSGYLFIDCADRDPARVKDLLQAWYRRQAKQVFVQVLDGCWQSFGKHYFDCPTGMAETKPSLQIRSMHKRWGSLTSTGRMTLNLALIRAPRECIEYVVVHELCHLAHDNHSRDFYKFLSRKMPDWEERKDRLEKTLA